MATSTASSGEQVSDRPSEREGDREGEVTGRRRRRAVRPGVEQRSDDVRAWEDDDRAWGEGANGDEDRIRREVPPHWG